MRGSQDFAAQEHPFDIRPVLKKEDSQLRVVLAADDLCHSLHKLAP